VTCHHAPPGLCRKRACTPLLARLYAARGVRAMDELDTRSAALLPPDQLKGALEAASLLADAIAAKNAC